jgi:hypothetical protein
MDISRWCSEAESKKVLENGVTKKPVGEELADVVICAFFR